MKKLGERAFVVALLLSLSAPFLLSQDSEIRLSQYAHRVWHIENGAFSGTLTNIAQTADGYLWVGTSTGLMYFDGVRFVPWVPLSETQIDRFGVRALAATKDGSLWIGSGDLFRLKNGILTRFKLEGHIHTFQEDADGGLWFTQFYTENRQGPLCHIVNSDMNCLGTADGFDGNEGANAVYRDQHGALWVAEQTKILTGQLGSFRTIPLVGSSTRDIQFAIQFFADSPDGAILAAKLSPTSTYGLYEYKNGQWAPYRLPGFDGAKVTIMAMKKMRDGSLWIGTSSGLVVIRGKRVERYGVADGLSSNLVEDIVDDREGNVWVLTSDGLDSFRIPKVITFSSRSGLSSGPAGPIRAVSNGSVYVGTPSGLDEISGNLVRSVLKTVDMHVSFQGFFTEDRSGRLFAEVGNSLAVREGKHFRTLAFSDGAPVPVPFNVFEDSNGDLWGPAPGRMVLRIHGNTVTKVHLVPDDLYVMWIGGYEGGAIVASVSDGSLITYKNGAVKQLTPADAGPVKMYPWSVTELEEGRLMAIKEGALQFFQDGKWNKIGMRNGLPCNVPFHYLFDRHKTLWVYASCGIFAVDRSDLNSLWTDSDAKLNYKFFDSLDGVHAARSDIWGMASAMSTDGRLWFGNGQDIETIDPARIPLNTLPPPVHIQSVIADKKTYTSQSALRLPEKTHDLEIDYTALSLVIPEKVHFRYRLDGRDNEWQDPGTRRQAFYTDLPPGEYTFHVIASNNDGVWNTTGDAVSLFIPPAFYQTSWFKVFMAITVVCLLWGLYTRRLRRVTAEINGRLGERLQERERIARELHDSLLQDLQAVILRFQLVANRLTKGDPNRVSMESGLDYADKVLADGRNQIRDIRSDTHAMDELSKSLQGYGEELAALWPETFHLTVTGEQFEVDPSLRDEIYRIGREAIGNAFRHSRGSSVKVEIAYLATGFLMRVSDDGEGIDPGVASMGRAGHWGIANMQERAQKIGASLKISRLPKGGSQVELTIPLELAKGRHRFWFFWRRKNGLQN